MFLEEILPFFFRPRRRPERTDAIDEFATRHEIVKSAVRKHSSEITVAGESAFCENIAVNDIAAIAVVEIDGGVSVLELGSYIGKNVVFQDIAAVGAVAPLIACSGVVDEIARIGHAASVKSKVASPEINGYGRRIVNAAISDGIADTVQLYRGTGLYDSKIRVSDCRRAYFVSAVCQSRLLPAVEKNRAVSEIFKDAIFRGTVSRRVFYRQTVPQHVPENAIFENDVFAVLQNHSRRLRLFKYDVPEFRVLHAVAEIKRVRAYRYRNALYVRNIPRRKEIDLLCFTVNRIFARQVDFFNQIVRPPSSRLRVAASDTERDVVPERYRLFFSIYALRHHR